MFRIQSEWSRRIVEHCAQCQTGAYHEYEEHRAICWHPSHPGTMGGCGTEWAERCSDFRDAGGARRVKTITKVVPV